MYIYYMNECSTGNCRLSYDRSLFSQRIFDEDRMGGAQDSGTESSNPDIDMLTDLSQGGISPSPSTPSTPLSMIVFNEPPPSPSTPSTDGLLTDMPFFHLLADPDTPDGGASSSSSSSGAAAGASSSTSSSSSARGEGRSASSRSRYRPQPLDGLPGERRGSSPFVDDSKSGGQHQDQADYAQVRRWRSRLLLLGLGGKEGGYGSSIPH